VCGILSYGFDYSESGFVHLELLVDFSVVVMANVLVGCNFMFSH